MDYETVKTSVLLGNTLVIILLAILHWLDKKTGAPFKKIMELEKRINEKCDKVTAIELEMQHFPKTADVIRVHERIDTLTESLNQKLDQMKDSANKDSKEISMLLGKLIGRIDHINKD